MTKVRSIFLVVAVVAVLALGASAADDDGSAVLRAFAQWLGEHKVQSNINLGVFQNYRLGGVAGKALTTEDFLVKVPKEIIITPEVAQTQGPFPQYTEWSYSTEPFVMFVLYHRMHQSSSWKPYTDILPVEFSGSPITWEDADLAELQASPVKGQVELLRKQLFAAYQKLAANTELLNSVFTEGAITFERYLWGFLVTSSRLFTIGNTPALVPLVDMLNHDPTAAVGSIDEQGDYFIVNSTREYQKGEQTFVSYGAKSNGDLLKGYGFLLENNPADHVSLHFALQMSNLVETIVEPVLRRVDPSYSEVAIALNRRPDRLLRSYRLSLMEFKELEHLTEALEGKPVSLANELKAYRGIITGLQKLYQAYGTTEQDDAELLADASLSANKRIAVTLRKSEKEIIQNNILVMAKLWENILLEGALPLGVPIR